MLISSGDGKQLSTQGTSYLPVIQNIKQEEMVWILHIVVLCLARRSRWSRRSQIHYIISQKPVVQVLLFLYCTFAFGLAF